MADPIVLHDNTDPTGEFPNNVAIHAGFNDTHELLVEGQSLVGQGFEVTGPARKVLVIPPLFFDVNGNLIIDLNSIANLTAMQASITTLQAQVADLQKQLTILGQTTVKIPSTNASLFATGALIATLSHRDFLNLPSPMASVGALSARFSTPYQIAATFIGQSTLFGFIGGRTILITAAATANAALAVDLILTRTFVPMPMSAQSALSGVLRQRMGIVSAFAGSGSLAVDVYRSGMLATAQMAGAGSLAGSVYRDVTFFNTVLAGASNLSATTRQWLAVGGQLAGAGSLSATTLRTSALQGLFAGIGGGSGVLPQSFTLQSLIAGAGGQSIASSFGVYTQIFVASVSGAGSFSVAEQQTLITLPSQFAASGSLSGTATQIVVIQGLFAGAGVVTAQAIRRTPISRVFAGAGSLSVDVTVLKAPVQIGRTGSYTVLSGSINATAFFTPRGIENAMLACLGGDTASDVSGSVTVTWGSQPMTLLGSIFANGHQILFYGLLFPSTSATTFTVNNANNWVLNAISIVGANQSSLAAAFSNFNSASFSGPVPSVSITSTVSSLVVGLFKGGGELGTPNQVAWFNTGAASPFVEGNYAPGAASVGMSGGSNPGNQAALAAGISVNP